MYNWVHPALVIEFRRMAFKDEAEHARLVKLAKAVRSVGEGPPAWRRAETGLKDRVAWLSCQLQSRLSTGMDAAAC